MSTFQIPIELGDPTGRNFEPLSALVDTGSTYTVIPSSILERLGVAPHRTSVFELADGRREEWRMGRTWLRLDGRLEMTLVVFGAEGVDLILGAVTLEEFLLGVDPVRHELVPVTGLMMLSVVIGLIPWLAVEIPNHRAHLSTSSGCEKQVLLHHVSLSKTPAECADPEVVSRSLGRCRCSSCGCAHL